MNELNDKSVFLGDVYCLNYYGILVFFYVSKTTAKTVYLVELGTKRYKNGIMLTKNLKASKKPYIILNNNTYTKTTYEVIPEKNLSLPIMITSDLPIYKKALDNVDFPLTGVFYAEKIFDYINRYWVVDNFNEKLDKISFLA